jgi:hypothetical protein
MIVILMIMLVSTTALAATENWPVDEGTVIASGHEFSGAVWDENTETLYSVHDNGYLLSMNKDGSDFESTYLGGDLEGITIVDGREGYLYVVVENPDTIKEIKDGAFTGMAWDLTEWMSGEGNYGAEAITWIPAGEHGVSGVESGVFAVGLQQDGKFYVFSVDFEESESVKFHETFAATYAGFDMAFDLAGSHYDSVTKTLYAVYDAGYHVLAALQLDSNGEWETVNKYSLPGKSEEGFAIVDFETVILAEDSGELYSYTGFDLGYPEEVVEEDIEEEEEVSTSPIDDDQESNLDSDGDGLLDSIEAELGSDPFEIDSDGDTLSDFEEVELGTDPNVRDTDKDGFRDSREVNAGTNPLDIENRPIEKIVGFSFDGTVLEISLEKGRDYFLEPFIEQKNSDIIYAWTNKYNKALFVTNGKLLVGYKNGVVFKEINMYNWKIESYSQVSDNEIAVTYNSGYSVVIEPFIEESSKEVTHIWMNKNSRVLYVSNSENEGIGYRNGIAFKEFNVNPKWFAEK